MERYILGIDIGTTSVKALLISESGALAAEGKADHDLISAHPGWAEENAEVWWSNAVAAVRQITDAHPDMAENIVSAGVSGMVPALVLLDHDGKPVRNTIQQNDARAGRDLCHVHFIDIDLPKNGMCLAPGDGTLPMKDYLKVLSDRGYTGGITPELWGTTYHHCAEQAMEKSLAFLRENSL